MVKRRFIAAFLLITIFSPYAWSTSNKCIPLVLHREMEEFYYLAQDPQVPTLKTEGYLSRSGDLTLVFQTRLEDGTRSPLLRGRAQFNAIMRHFGTRVRRIEGSWIYGDNLEEFNALTGPPSNLSPEVAASRTWTGQRAAEWRFRHVQVETLQGTPGHYTRVKIYFLRRRPR